MAESSGQNANTKMNWFRVVVNLILCMGILAGAAYVIYVINSNEPTAEKLNSTRKSAALVETIKVLRGNHAPKIQVLGTVQAAQRIRLSPQISGQIIQLSDQFVPGGMVQKNDLLLKIDSADFETALSISQSELEQANASMEIEKARQRLAAKELTLLEGTITEANRGLVLREPQVASIKAQVSAAKASVQRAELNLHRTNVFAPFDAQVLSRAVNVGSQVGIGDELGQLVGVKEYWINAAVPVRHLRWIRFAEADSIHRLSAGNGTAPTISKKLDDSGSTVILRDTDAWGAGVERRAKVMRMIGTLDQQTRLARILISVSDPLGVENGEPPLIIASLVDTEIEGRTIDDVVKLERQYVRDNDTVWLFAGGKLEIRKTEVIFRDADFAYISDGLETGDEVVMTNLATVVDGIRLRKTTSESAEESVMAEPGPDAL